MSRLRTLIVNDVSSSHTNLKDFRDAINAQVGAELALQNTMVTSTVGILLSPLFNTLFVQHSKERQNVGLIPAVSLLLNAVSTIFNNASTVVRQHGIALSAFNNILASTAGSPHELAPITPGTTPTPTPTH